MTHSLYYKFILGYLVFGLLGFASIATLSSRMTERYFFELPRLKSSEAKASRTPDAPAATLPGVSSMYSVSEHAPPETC